MFSSLKRTCAKALALATGLALLAGCTPNTTGESIFDPYEKRNRAVHGFNKGVDRAILSPTATGYGTLVPSPLRRGVSNFASNLDQPGAVVNNLLQGNMEHALENFWRLLVNSTVGIGGLFDPASRIGLEKHRTGFGMTLGTWGIPEGAYVELPLLGPSTERDTVGTMMDFALNPLHGAASAQQERVITGSKVLSKVGDRYEYSGFVDSILYESADSYAQARLLYLQNRRGELGDTAASEADDDEIYDSYEDFYAN